MDNNELLSKLIDLAEELGIAIRRAPAGDASSSMHPGGNFVRLRDKEIIFLDTTACPADQIAVVAHGLAGRDELSDRFLPPQVRQAIEDTD